MKVVDLRNAVKRVSFTDLFVGQTYFDKEKNLCIKTSTDSDDYNNCIFHQDGVQKESHEEPFNLCELCSATITIEG